MAEATGPDTHQAFSALFAILGSLRYVKSKPCVKTKFRASFENARDGALISIVERLHRLPVSPLLWLNGDFTSTKLRCASTL